MTDAQHKPEMLVDEEAGEFTRNSLRRLETLLDEDPQAAQQVFGTARDMNAVLTAAQEASEATDFRKRLIGSLAVIWENEHDFSLGFDEHTESQITKTMRNVTGKEAVRFNRIATYVDALAVWSAAQSDELRHPA